VVKNALILAIESSCDETSVAVMQGFKVLSHVTYSQAEHAKYGGVIPEVAGRAHQSKIIVAVDRALIEAKKNFSELQLISVTQGPGLNGALLVGLTYAKSLALALRIPIYGVHHMRAHILAHFADEHKPKPQFPFLNLTVSGGHTQLVLVNSPSDMKVLAETIDDAAGEAFDKAAKLLGFEYPGGPQIDKNAQTGNAQKYKFSVPKDYSLGFSFSGVKTSLLYFLRDELQRNPNFIEEEKANICASFQNTIVNYLLRVSRRHIESNKVKTFGIAGGVSANSELRKQALQMGIELGIEVHIPDFEFCTDNAAMIGVAGYFMHLNGEPELAWEASTRPRWKLA
jgi:N6-L-threonylcarbamoyladenine synthase